MWHRAAQFAPFAALTGYDSAIAEAARETDGEWQCDESAAAELDRTLSAVVSRLNMRPVVSVRYFEPDARKTGGSYLTRRAPLKAVDTVQRLLVFADGGTIPLRYVQSLQLVD